MFISLSMGLYGQIIMTSSSSTYRPLLHATAGYLCSFSQSHVRASEIHLFMHIITMQQVFYVSRQQGITFLVSYVLLSCCSNRKDFEGDQHVNPLSTKSTLILGFLYNKYCNPI